MPKQNTTQEVIQQKARESAAEKLPIFEMGARGFLGCEAPRNFPGVDALIFKLNDDAIIIKTARIQSKYTSSIKGSYIPLERLGFDFLVAVRDVVRGKGTGNRKHPQIYVIPLAEVEKIWDKQAIHFSRISRKFLFGYEKKTDVWQVIVDFLNASD